MDWAAFWSQFRTAVDSNKDLSEEHKLAYLRDAIKDPSVRSLMFSGAERKGLYAEVVGVLHERFDKRRTIHATYCHQITSLSTIKNTKTDLHQLVDKVKHAVSGLKHTGQYDLPAFLTSFLTSCLPKGLQVEWEVHSKDSKDVPPLDDFLQFCSFRADVLSTSTTPTPEIKSKSSDPKPEQHQRKHHRAAVNAAAPKVNSPKPSLALLDSGMSACSVRVQSILFSLARLSLT